VIAAASLSQKVVLAFQSLAPSELMDCHKQQETKKKVL
jgi:hypothetical protein